MLSLARSRYTLALQFAFLATNTAGLLFAIIYNASTPDLYPNNAHHKVGWVAAAVMAVHLSISVLSHVAGVFRKTDSEKSGGEYQAFLPVSSESMAERDRLQSAEFARTYRLSNDSGHGTEPKTESLRSGSMSSADGASPRLSVEGRKEYADHDDDLEDGPAMPMPSSPKRSSWLRRASEKIPARVFSGLMLVYNVIDRAILPFGFVVLCLGIIAYGRFFVRFSPHSIASGVLLTFTSAGGPGHLLRPRALDQGRHLLLARSPDPGSMVGQLRRARMGMSLDCLDGFEMHRLMKTVSPGVERSAQAS